jgi:hypothetical protein
MVPPPRQPRHRAQWYEVYSRATDPQGIHYHHARSATTPDYAHRLVGGPG